MISKITNCGFKFINFNDNGLIVTCKVTEIRIESLGELN